MDYSSDVMAYPAAVCDSIFDVATAISFYCIYTQTNYDMANDSTTSDRISSTSIPYGTTTVFDQSTSHARNHTNTSRTFIWTTFAIASYMVFFVLTLAASFHYTIIVIRFPCHSPSCSASSTPCAYYNYTFGS